MTRHLKTLFAALSLGMSALAAQAATAETVYESATYTGVDTGEYIVQDGRSIGAAFALDQATDITGIGAQFGGFPSGTIFGAIVPLTSLDAYPAGDPAHLEDIALASTVFAVPTATAIDPLQPLSVTLDAGTYAVIFGSGQFGASGWAGLGDQNDTIGSPIMFQTLFDNVWMPQSADGIRIFVEGTPAAAAVPEPASWALMVVGFGIAGATMRRRRAFALAA